MNKRLDKAYNFIKLIPSIEREARGFEVSLEKGLHKQGTIAQCKIGEGLIVVDEDHFERMSWEELVETLVHEVAHINSPSSPIAIHGVTIGISHGKGWRNKFNKLLKDLEVQIPNWFKEPEENNAHLSQLAEEADLKSAKSGFKSQDGQSSELKAHKGSSPFEGTK